MALIDGMRFGKNVIISGSKVEIDGKTVTCIDELIVLSRDARERHGLNTDTGTTYLVSTKISKDSITSTDICITKDSIKVGGIPANSIEELKMLMRISDTEYKEKHKESRPGGRFLSWLFSRQT